MNEYNNYWLLTAPSAVLIKAVGYRDIGSADSIH